MRERAFAGVETIDEHAVGAEVGGQREAVVGVGDDAVCVRMLLARGDLAGADVLHDLERIGERGVRADAERRDRAADVVGDQRHSARAIGADVAGRRPARLARADGGEAARARVDGEGAHRAGRVAGDLVHFVDDEE